MGTLSNNTKVGDKGKDLILQTSGRVYVNVKDRFYPLNFNEDDRKSKEKEEETEKTPIILFIDDDSELETYTYPGDDHLIISNTGTIYKTKGGEYIQINIKSTASQSNIFNSPITIRSSSAPFIISSNKLVQFLNAEYLDGLSADKFLRKNIDTLTLSSGEFEEIFTNTISDKNNKTLIDLNNSNLTIDTINVKNINIASENNDNINDNDDDENITPSLPINVSFINNKTYIENGFKVLSSNIINKTEYYFKSESSTSDSTEGLQWFSYNENAEVGGFSIYTLIEAAYNNNYIDNTITLVEYLKLLTFACKFENGEWIFVTVTEENLIIEEDQEIPNLKFIPKTRDIFEGVPYGDTSNCAVKIYDRWFDISTCPDDIKNKYTGLTFECKIKNNTVNAGIEVYGTNSNGKIEGLVVGGTEDTIRIIVTGTDCEFLYLNENYDDTPEVDPETGNTITNPLIDCIEANNRDKGTVISADIKAEDILITKSYNNIIGDLKGIKNSIFGDLTSYGFTSEGNCYLVNPGIALVNTTDVNYLKLTNKEKSFIGINSNNENFITIDTNGNCDIKRSNMYDINNYNISCSFGPIVVQEDGSATIGTGTTQITISATGEISIPSAAIK